MSQLSESTQTLLQKARDAIISDTVQDFIIDNAGRAALAEAAMTVGTDYAADRDRQTHAGDLIANVMHFCNQHDIRFETVLESGRRHFEAEIQDKTPTV